MLASYRLGVTSKFAAKTTRRFMKSDPSFYGK